MHYYLELVNVAIKDLNPSTNTIEGRTLSINITLGVIWNMLCIPYHKQRKIKIEEFTPTKGKNIWNTRDKALEFYNKDTQWIVADQ